MHEAALFEAKLAGPSQSNGQLMRCAAIALYGHRLRDEDVAALCRADCALSHIAPQCADASTVYCIALAQLLVDRNEASEAKSIKCVARDRDRDRDDLSFSSL